MAGTFIAQNKIRPGAYMVFKSAANSRLTSGTRGVVALPMNLPWGDSQDLITVTASDFIGGKTLKLLGLNSTDAAALPLREVFKNAGTALVYRMNVNPVKASITSGDFIFTAAHGGVFGNSIVVSCVQNTELSVLELVTTVAGVEVDRQVVTTLSSYARNGWVDIAPVTPNEDPTFTAFAGVTLGGASGTAGTDGTASTDYQAFMDKCSNAVWNVMAVTTKTEGVPSKIKAYIKDLRENSGKKVQAVVFSYPQADYEGIISVDQGYKIGDEIIDAENFIAYVAGVTAGATAVESNTFKVVEGATEIIGQKSDSDIENGLSSGKFMLSMRQDRSIVIEKDINTLHNFTQDKSYVFSKNRIIRCLDDIATQVTSLFENSYIGKVNNDESGRTLFRGAVVGYLNSLQAQGGIQNFDSTTDVSVLAGNDIESVVCEIAVQPVDSMEKLYMTVVVS